MMYRLSYSLSGHVRIDAHEPIKVTEHTVTFSWRGREAVRENKVSDGVRWFDNIEDAVQHADTRLDCNQDRIDRMQLAINESRAALKGWIA